MADEMNVTSPSAALARQARNEAKVTSAMLWAMGLFLTDVKQMAHADRLHISPAGVASAWSSRMSAEALATRLDPVIAVYVADSQKQSAVPDQAYDTAMAVLTAANQRAWSAELTSDALDLALSIDTPPAALTAAAPDHESARGQRLHEEFRKALGETEGMAWGDVARRDARTAVTGLDGMLSQSAMAQQGVGSKMWVARHDDRVRSEHSAADGQVVPLSSTFTVGGYPMMHPGDRSAPSRLTINCRCVMVSGDEDTDYAAGDVTHDRREAESLAHDVYRESAEAEPAITDEMKSLATATDQRLEGLKYRLKDPSSLARKIANDAVVDGVSQAQAAANVSDGVRYTMISDPKNYAASVQDTLDRLRSQGWGARVKNAWAQSERAYQGVNVGLTSPDGQLVELQFHTRESFDAKMSKTMHGTYEKQRVLERGTPQWQTYEKQMHDFMAQVPVPPGASSIS